MLLGAGSHRTRRRPAPAGPRRRRGREYLDPAGSACVQGGSRQSSPAPPAMADRCTWSTASTATAASRVASGSTPRPRTPSGSPGRFSSNFQRFAGNGLASIGGGRRIAGGYIDLDHGIPFFSHQLHVYDPVANTLTRKADMPRGLAGGIVGVIDGELVPAAGEMRRRLLAPGREGHCLRMPTAAPPQPRRPIAGPGGRRHLTSTGTVQAGVIGGKLYVGEQASPRDRRPRSTCTIPLPTARSARRRIPTPGGAIRTASHRLLFYV